MSPPSELPLVVDLVCLWHDRTCVVIAVPWWTSSRLTLSPVRKVRAVFFRHSTINSIIHCAFAAAAIPARLKPTGLLRTDGKGPDGVTIVPWEHGKCAVWDFTCPDTLAPSYRAVAVSVPGSVTAQAEKSTAH